MDDPIKQLQKKIAYDVSMSLLENIIDVAANLKPRDNPWWRFRRNLDVQEFATMLREYKSSLHAEYSAYFQQQADARLELPEEPVTDFFNKGTGIHEA